MCHSTVKLVCGLCLVLVGSLPSCICLSHSGVVGPLAHPPGLEGEISWGRWVQAGSWSAVSLRTRDTHTTQEQLRRTIQFIGAGREVLMPLAVPGSLGQGLCSCVSLARAGVLEDASSAYSRGAGGLTRSNEMAQG